MFKGEKRRGDSEAGLWRPDGERRGMPEEASFILCRQAFA